MDIVLIPGLWLDGSAWDAVLPGLEAAGHRGIPVTLPGQGDGSADATLDDQLATILAAVDAAQAPVLVVGHSAASTLAWLAADRRPDAVGTVALVGGMPASDGTPYAPWFQIKEGRANFPGWEQFAGPDSDDLDDATKDQVAANAHPVPQAVVEGIVRYTNPDRATHPVVMVCPEYSPEDAKGWVAAGEIPELAVATNLSYADIDSGHWPMFSKPDDLARVLAGLAP